MWQPQLHREFEANLGAWVWFVWRACLITHEACVNSAPNYQGKQVYVGIRVLRGLITHMLTPEQKIVCYIQLIICYYFVSACESVRVCVCVCVCVCVYEHTLSPQDLCGLDTESERKKLPGVISFLLLCEPQSCQT